MITHVAIRFGGKVWSLPKPNRHHHIIRKIVEETGAKSVDTLGDDQGFLDDEGNYLTRSQAHNHAVTCGQIQNWDCHLDDTLFSEDVW